MMQRVLMPVASVVRFNLRRCTTVAAVEADTAAKRLQQLQAVKFDSKSDSKNDSASFRRALRHYLNKKGPATRQELGKLFLETDTYTKLRAFAVLMQKRGVYPTPSEARHMLTVMLANTKSLDAQEKIICRQLLNSTLVKEYLYPKVFEKLDHFAVLELVASGQMKMFEMKIRIPAYLIRAGNLLERPETEKLLKKNKYSEQDMVHLKMELSLADGDFEALVDQYHSLPVPTAISLAILIRACKTQLFGASAETREQFKKLADRAFSQGEDEGTNKRLLEAEHKRFMWAYRTFGTSVKAVNEATAA